MENALAQFIRFKAKTAFLKFIQLGFGGVFLSLFLLILLDFFHDSFCTNTSNLHFWKCSYSLLVHLVFLLLFPILYLLFALYYAQKYLLYLIVELFTQKAKYESIQWVIQNTPKPLETMIERIGKKIGIPDMNHQKILESLINLPFQKINDIFMPNLMIFYVLLSTELLAFIYLWVKL